jgi:MFS family permease
MFLLLSVSAVVMGLSYTIAKEEMFRGMRERCGGRGTWLGYLLSCPYCLSHWVAFIVVPITGCYYVHMAWRVPYLSRVVDWFLSSILVTVVAAFLRVIFFFVDETQAFVRRRKKVAEKLEERIEEKIDEHIDERIDDEAGRLVPMDAPPAPPSH